MQSTALLTRSTERRRVRRKARARRRARFPLTAGAGRTVSWTAWNMPSSITSNGSTQSWLYTPEHSRYKLTAPGRTTWYLNPSVHSGGHYEQTHYASGTVEHRVTLYGGGKPIGEVLSFDGGAPSQTRYFHSDAQGSITAVTNQAGAVVTRFRYDPWGKQTLISGSNTGIDATRQGHTGHEMLDGGLTHMNGRLYDPTLSRFVSADPIVQDPFDLQSLNRYSYVWNNPLGYTDPTGFSAWTDFRDGFLKPVVGIAAGFLFGPAGAWALTGNAFANSLIAGAISGGITGGRQGALQGALTGGLFYGAGQVGNSLGLANNSAGRALLHAGAGCISASAGGGSCGTGAMTAGFTKFASSNLPNYGDVGNLIKYAVIGGTAAEIGGGKFANGAMTGAFQYLFNQRTTRAYLRSNTGTLEVRARFLESKIQELGGTVPSMIGRLGSGATETYIRALEARFEQVVSRADAAARSEFRREVVSEVLLTGGSSHGLTRNEIDFVRDNHRLPSGFVAHHTEPINVNPMRAGARDNLELLRHADHVQVHRELRGAD